MAVQPNTKVVTPTAPPTDYHGTLANHEATCPTTTQYQSQEAASPSEAVDMRDDSFATNLLQARGSTSVLPNQGTNGLNDTYGSILEPVSMHKVDRNSTPPQSPPRFTATEKGKGRETQPKRPLPSPELGEREALDAEHPAKRFHQYSSPRRPHYPIPTTSPSVVMWNAEMPQQSTAEDQQMHDWSIPDPWSLSTPKPIQGTSQETPTPLPTHAPTPMEVDAPTAGSNDASMPHPLLLPNLEQQIAATPSWRPSLHYNSDLTPNLGYTKRPSGGFPAVHYRHPFFVVANLEERQRMGWSMVDDPKLLLHSFGVGGGEETERAETKAALIKAVAFILKRDDFEVAAPKPEEPTLRKNTPPYCFLLTGITLNEQQRLLIQGIWSFPYVTFQALEYAFAMPTLIHSIRGISTKNDNADKAVWNAFQEPVAQAAILRFAASNPIFGNMSDEEVLNTMLASLRTRPLDIKSTGGIPQDVVNIYIMSPTLLAHEWLEFQELVQSLAYFDPRDGTATPAGKMECRQCHGADHPTGMCPFLAIPDWNGRRQPYEHARTATTSERQGGYQQYPLAQVDTNLSQPDRGFRGFGRGRPAPRRDYARTQNWRQ